MKIAVNTRFLIKGKMTGLGHFTFELLKQLVVQHPEDEFIFLFDRKIDPDFVFASNITPVMVFPPARARRGLHGRGKRGTLEDRHPGEDPA